MSAGVLGELRPDVWLRPANLLVTIEQDDVMVSRGERAGGAGQSLATRLWDLPTLRISLVRLSGEADRAIELLTTGDPTVLAETFVISVAITRALAAEPQLPDELVGRDWPADDLRAQYQVLARRHGRALEGTLVQIRN